MIARLRCWLRDLRLLHRCDDCGRRHAIEYLLPGRIVCHDCAGRRWLPVEDLMRESGLPEELIEARRIQRARVFGEP